MPQLLDLLPGQCAAPEKPPERAEGRAAIAPAPKGNWQDLCEKLGERLGQGIPKPGSPEDCAALEQLRQWFAGISRDFEKLLQERLTSRSVLARLRLDNVPNDRLGVTGAIVGVWNGLVQDISNVDEAVTDMVIAPVSGIYTLYKCLFQRFDADAAIGVAVIKTVLNSFQKIRVGTDAALWFTADNAVDFEVLNHFLDQLARWFVPLNIPEAGEATDAWLADRITREQRDCIWRYHGFDPETYERFSGAYGERLDWREQIQYLLRLGKGEQEISDALRKRGFVREENFDAAREMYNELPGISDHLHWLQRNVFDTDYVETYQLLDGFDTRFWPEFGHDLTALGMRKKYAQYHYAAHWIMPSPEQLARFVYRSDEIQAATGKPFTLDDFERILTEQDYNKLARGWFRATAYQIPPISYLKEWYRQNVINKEELASYHRRLGYDPKDAERFTEIDDLQKRRMRTSAIHGWTPTNANSAYAQGQIDEAAHDSLFIALGYTKEEAASGRQVATAKLQGQIVTRARSRVLSSVVNSVRAGLATGTLGPQQAAAALTAAGWPEQLAAGIAQLESVAARTTIVKQAVTYIRRHYLSGAITLDRARNELQSLGIVPDAVVRYTQIWQLQFTPGRKQRTAKDIVNDYATHQLTRGQAISRLRNLGYDNPDIRLYLADAVAKTAKADAARQKAEESKGLKRNRELLKVAKEIDTQRRAVVKAMIKDQPVSKLEKWLKQGLIGKRYFTERMQQYGYSPESIRDRIDEACGAKGAACTNGESASPPAAPAGGGGGGGPGGG